MGKFVVAGGSGSPGMRVIKVWRAESGSNEKSVNQNWFKRSENWLHGPSH